MTRPLKSPRVRIAFFSICSAAIAVWLLVGFYYPGTFRKERNLGHRLGGDACPDLIENTLEVFRTAIPQFKPSDGYLYSECDIRETLDHHLVIFHDWDLERLVPDSTENRKALGVGRIGDQKICELTLRQVKALRLRRDQEIPTLEEVLREAMDLNLKKPLLLEIKHLHSDEGRQAVIDIARKYRDQSSLEIHFLAFTRNLSRSFPDTRTWLDKFHENGFRVYQTYRPKTPEYDLCKTWRH